MLTIRFICFGEISHHIPSGFSLSFDSRSLSVAAMLAALATHFPDAVSRIEKCACAQGDALIHRDTLIIESGEMVLLSPVSGG